ncbi:MAG TPA: ABC transporter ATP-binding protein [Xanthobacteraceae bacterium]|jgi:NitT/TauT family transport system ATP-binding protein|nr:ABC transporter ATP-binding protein [Xanthobacteraceae bacterium]
MMKKTAGGKLEARDLSKAYGSGRFAKTVVDRCSFTVEDNKLTVMIGPSGSGKSTMVRLLASFEQPTAGSVLLDGKSVTKPSSDRLVVFQETALYPWMTTYTNVIFGPEAQGRSEESCKNAADELIHRVGLSQFRESYPHELSGGMQRRAELARALINNPAIMILDEPFRGLDAMTKGLMQEYYARLFESSRNTHLFVTTDIDEAIFLADRLLIMSNFPLRLREVIDVNLPRPRKLADVVESDMANDLKKQALTLLHEEAMKSFAFGGYAAGESSRI